MTESEIKDRAVVNLGKYELSIFLHEDDDSIGIIIWDGNQIILHPYIDMKKKRVSIP